MPPNHSLVFTVSESHRQGRFNRGPSVVMIMMLRSLWSALLAFSAPETCVNKEFDQCGGKVRGAALPRQAGTKASEHDPRRFEWQEFKGDTCCPTYDNCSYVNDFYFQCQPKDLCLNPEFGQVRTRSHEARSRKHASRRRGRRLRRLDQRARPAPRRHQQNPCPRRVSGGSAAARRRTRLLRRGTRRTTTRPAARIRSTAPSRTTTTRSACTTRPSASAPSSTSSAAASTRTASPGGARTTPTLATKSRSSLAASQATTAPRTPAHRRTSAAASPSPCARTPALASAAASTARATRGRRSTTTPTAARPLRRASRRPSTSRSAWATLRREPLRRLLHARCPRVDAARSEGANEMLRVKKRAHERATAVSDRVHLPRAWGVSPTCAAVGP